MSTLLTNTFEIFNYVGTSQVSIYCVGLLTCVLAVKIVNRLMRR